MQCLYCDAELKPFRGLFDEDFCCREHREKYFSSFRKSLTRLPFFEDALAGEARVPDTTSEELDSALVIAAAADVAPSEPPIANFLPMIAAPMQSTEIARGVPPDPFFACAILELAQLPKIVWSAGPQMEDQPAELLDAVQTGAKSAIHPEPMPLCKTPPVLSSLLALAESLPAPPMAEAADFVLLCRQLVSAPAAAPELPLLQDCELPAFAVSRESMQSDEFQGAAIDAENEDLEDLRCAPAATMEMAPVLPMTSASTGCIPAQASYAAEMITPSLALRTAPSASATDSLQVPAPAPWSTTVPALGPDSPRAESQNIPAEPHAHEPLRPSFGASVRIKNWRLRITFAKPA